MKTIIAGSRTITDYELVKSVIDACPWEITEIISGCAIGVDQLGERYALENAIPVSRFPVLPEEWDQYGKYAGPRRNGQMAEAADALILIHQGTKGSIDMLEKAFKKGLLLHIRKIANVP